MDWKSKWIEWQSVDHIDSYITDDLKCLTQEEAKEQFGKHLTFGTGGARGTFGSGINRINHYTIRRITQGFLNYLDKHVEDSKTKGIAISYDTRHFSKEFAENVAYLAASQGFKVYLSDETRATPLLSYMVRYYGAAGGVMITASHNPPNYNGYKIYDQTGGQMTEVMAEGIVDELSKVTEELKLAQGPIKSFVSDGTIRMIGDDIDQSYLTALSKDLKNPVLFKQSNDFHVVYTPLHGAGLSIIKKALKRFKFDDYSLVNEQLTLDGAFETVKSPNPEDKESFAYAEALGKKENAKLIMATDPDADRLGVAVWDKNKYVYLTGNQLGAILLTYLIENSKSSELKISVLIKTIVTSELGADIAKKNGVVVIDTLTGFKYIGEKITEIEESGHIRFLFGYEESYGYLFSSIVRDKDAVQAVVLLLEAALYYDKKNQSLLDVLDEIYSNHGYFSEELMTILLENEKQKETIQNNIFNLKNNLKKDFGGFNLKVLEDYSNSEKLVFGGASSIIDLPKSDVIKLIFEDDSWIAIRPSGTEPKYKIYFSSRDMDKENAEKKLMRLKETLFSQLFM